MCGVLRRRLQQDRHYTTRSVGETQKKKNQEQCTKVYVCYGSRRATRRVTTSAPRTPATKDTPSIRIHSKKDEQQQSKCLLPTPYDDAAEAVVPGAVRYAYGGDRAS